MRGGVLLDAVNIQAIPEQSSETLFCVSLLYWVVYGFCVTFRRLVSHVFFLLDLRLFLCWHVPLFHCFC